MTQLLVLLALLAASWMIARIIFRAVTGMSQAEYNHHRAVKKASREAETALYRGQIAAEGVQMAQDRINRRQR